MILIAVPLLFQLAFIGLVAKVRQDGAEAVGWTIHTKDVIAQAQRCRVRILAAHAAGEGYTITRDPAFEGALTGKVASVPVELRSLVALVSDNPTQRQAADQIRADAVSFLATIEAGRAALRVDGRIDSPAGTARLKRSQGMVEALERQFDAFLDEERRLDSARRDRLGHSWVTLDAILVDGGIASVLCTVLVAILFARNIGGRIAALTENVRRLGEGKELAPPIAGADEVSRLDGVFREMVRTLAEAVERERAHAVQLRRRAEELVDVNAQLREKAQENEMFVYSVSHDLRSPLVNLQGFGKELGFLGRDLAKLVDRDGVPDDVRRRARSLIDLEMAESIGFIQTAVSRLSGIIDALLRLSRAGRVEYRRQSVDVPVVVDRVVGALRGSIDGRRAVVSVGKLPPAWGDPTAIEQVFANLIGNAVNYLDPDRPGRIEVEAVDPAGVVEPELPADSTVYAVRDNGLGIADAYKAKVFTAFQRLHGDVAKGEGVGLTMVKRMVERHGGRVWFESQPGRGSTFFVALPSAEAAPLPSDEREPAMAETGTTGPRGRDHAWPATQ